MVANSRALLPLVLLSLAALMGCAEPEDENLFTWDVKVTGVDNSCTCLLYTSPSPRDRG